MESIHRTLWVYFLRHKGESNDKTQGVYRAHVSVWNDQSTHDSGVPFSPRLFPPPPPPLRTAKLRSIVGKCFPKSASSGLAPKDEPLDIFSEVLLLMSESRIDFVMKVKFVPSGLLAYGLARLYGRFCLAGLPHVLVSPSMKFADY